MLLGYLGAHALIHRNHIISSPNISKDIDVLSFSTPIWQSICLDAMFRALLQDWPTLAEVLEVGRPELAVTVVSVMAALHPHHPAGP